MALRFIDSFDHYATADLTKKWTTASNLGADATIAAGVGRKGTQGFSIRATTGRYIAKTLDSQATWVVGVAFSPGTAESGFYQLFQLDDAGSTQCELVMNADGTLSVTTNGTVLGTSSNALSGGVFSYVEWKVTVAPSGGTYAVNVNGVSWLTGTGNTAHTGNSHANRIRLGPVNFNFTTSGTAVFDDFYVCDGTGAANNDFLGDMVIQPLYPSGAGTTTQWGAVGSANWQNASEALQDGDTTYNTAATAGLVDTYAMQDLSVSPLTIKGVQWVGCLRKDDGSNYVLHRMIRSGGTNYEGSNALAPNTTYAFLTEILEQDPATSAAWTKVGVNAAEAGVKLVSVV